MSFFTKLFQRKNSAPIAKERLQILLDHERSSKGGDSDLLYKLQQEILKVIQRHISVDQDKVQVKVDRNTDFSTLEIDIEVPQQTDGNETTNINIASSHSLEKNE